MKLELKAKDKAAKDKMGNYGYIEPEAAKFKFSKKKMTMILTHFRNAEVLTANTIY